MKVKPVKLHAVNRVVTVVGNAIRTKRLKNGMTLRDLSAEARLSYTFLSECETGKKRMSYDRLHRVAFALDTTVGRLFARV